MDYCEDLTELQCTLVSMGLYMGYILIGIAALLPIVFLIIYIIKNPQGAKLSLIFVGVLVFIFLICWALSSGELPAGLAEKFDITQSRFKLVGGGIITFYVLLIIAIATILAGEGRNMLLKREKQ